MDKFTFQIINFTWTIELTSRYDERLIVENSCSWGTTNKANFLIRLDEGMSFQQLKKTLRHEIAHAIIRTASITYPENSSDKFLCEEDLCDFIGHWGEFIENVVNNFLKWREENERN